MKKFFTMLFLALCAFTSSAFADGGPTSQIVQSAQGEVAANGYCKMKFSADAFMEKLCFIAYAGTITNDADSTNHLNVALVKPVADAPHHKAGQVLTCSADLVVGKGGQISWRQTDECGYR